jgi:glycerophosphoryl diester phosphodiesterase
MPPLLLGHRGARAFRQVPENTLASFELCLQQGCDGFEFDVRCSADSQLVICHDADTKGTEIASAAAKSLSLPTLEDVLQQFAHRAFLDIELKVAGMESQVLRELRNHPPQKGCVVSSFIPEVLTAMRALDPATPLGFLCDRQSQLRVWPHTPTEWVIPRFDLADRELIEEVHAAGKRIMVWTVNRAESIHEFAQWSVDGLISDQTHRLAEILAPSR